MSNKLTIALLTHDRRERALEVMLNISNLILNNNDVDLLVIENPSKENIGLENVPNQHNVNYVLKDRNQGLDHSILQAAYYGKRNNRRIWFICDDDILFYENLDVVLDDLQNANTDVCYVPWNTVEDKELLVDCKTAYLRMSFLPCVSCIFKNINIRNLLPYIGTNYIHIALLNHTLMLDGNIKLLKTPAGRQSRNHLTRFPVFETFFEGYHKTLLEKQYLSELEIQKTVYKRAYAALSFLKGRNINLVIKIKFLIYIFKLPLITLKSKIKFLIKVIVQ